MNSLFYQIGKYVFFFFTLVGKNLIKKKFVFVELQVFFFLFDNNNIFLITCSTIQVLFNFTYSAQMFSIFFKKIIVKSKSIYKYPIDLVM